MKKRTKRITIIIVIIFVILLFPICLRYKDGGTTVYRSIVGIYEVTIWNQIGISAENLETRKEGITVKLFGRTAFDNSRTRLITESLDGFNGEISDYCLCTYYRVGCP